MCVDLVSHMVDPVGPVGLSGAAGQADGRSDVQGHEGGLAEKAKLTEKGLRR